MCSTLTLLHDIQVLKHLNNTEYRTRFINLQKLDEL